MFERLKTNSRIAADIVRGRAFPEALIPTERNHVELVITRAATGKTEYVDGYNSRTTAGSLWQATVMGSAVGAPALNIALSTTIITPAVGDTTLPGEILAGTSAGLCRHAGTYQNPVGQSVLGGSASYQIYNLFTSDGTYTVQSAALFSSLTVGSGSLFVEAVLSPAATLASGDSIALTWSVNI